MPVNIDAAADSRIAVRDSYRRSLERALADVRQQVPSGEWEGVPVVTDKDLLGTIDAVFSQPLPRIDLHTAEVETPGSVIVTTVCPRCDKAAEIKLTIGAELRVDENHATLNVKAASKAATHTCGQEALPIEREASDPIAEGQEALGLDELVGERCPNPGCILPADHEGDHEVASEAAPGAHVEPDPDDPDGDLLPGEPG